MQDNTEKNEHSTAGMHLSASWYWFYLGVTLVFLVILGNA